MNTTPETSVSTAVRAGIVGNIVATYLGRNEVPIESLDDVLSRITSATNILFESPRLTVVDAVVHSVFATQDMSTPAAIVEATVFKDGIISLVDGNKYKMLKRHLSTNGLTPAEYIAKFNLPSDYPMVCSKYSKSRSKLAKTYGLGRKAGSTAVTTPSEDTGDAAPSESDSPSSLWNGQTPPEGITSVEATIQPDHLICLEDGQSVKTLTRWLKSRHSMTFAEYKEKWNLPDDYPSVPPALSASRSAAQHKRWNTKKVA